MGQSDYHNLNPIYRFATEFSRLESLPFHFHIDSGHYETAIVFNTETNQYRRRNEQETWDDICYPEVMLVPDICDYDHKVIIEFEEETGNKKSGAKYAKKGHGHEGDMAGIRDERRNECYKQSGFKLLRIWESQFKKSTIWKISLSEFLINCYRKTLNDSIKIYANVPNIEQ